MNRNQLEEIVNYIVDQGLLALSETSVGDISPVDFLNIFSKNDQEYSDLIGFLEGEQQPEIPPEEARTGVTFNLREPIQTKAGELKLVRIRKPDPKRLQRGGLDFRVPDYEVFKAECLEKNSGDYTILIRKGFELVEIKGVDVLVYAPNYSLGERLGLYERR